MKINHILLRNRTVLECPSLKDFLHYNCNISAIHNICPLKLHIKTCNVNRDKIAIKFYKKIFHQFCYFQVIGKIFAHITINGDKIETSIYEDDEFYYLYLHIEPKKIKECEDLFTICINKLIVCVQKSCKPFREKNRIAFFCEIPCKLIL